MSREENTKMIDLRYVILLILLVNILNAQTPTQAPTQNPATVQMSSSERVWRIDINKDRHFELLIANQNQLSLFDEHQKLKWTTQNQGVVHLLTFGTLNLSKLNTSLKYDDIEQDWIISAWGVGRGFLEAPLTITAIDPKTGVSYQLMQIAGERAQAIHLQIIDINADAINDLLISHFKDKYFVTTSHLISGHKITPPYFLQQPLRMATSFLYADLGDDQQITELVGRVYGEEKGEFGDLVLRQAQSEIQVPLEKGLKGIFYGKIGDDKQLLFSDAWVANYGKKAKASLKRILFQNQRLQVERLAESQGEYTFFDFHPVEISVKLWHQLLRTYSDIIPTSTAQDQQYTHALFLQGSHFLSLCIPKNHGNWEIIKLKALEPVLNIAVLPQGDDFYVVVPKQGSTVVEKLNLFQRLNP